MTRVACCLILAASALLTASDGLDVSLPVCEPEPLPIPAPSVDLYVFGASYHRYRDDYHRAVASGDAHPVNPGLGVGLMWDQGHGWEIGGTIAAYSDSEGHPASLAMATVRHAWWDRVAVDVAAGYYRGSGWRLVGCAATVGVRIAGPLWVHGMYVPEQVTGQGFSVGVGFLRLRL